MVAGERWKVYYPGLLLYGLVAQTVRAAPHQALHCSCIASGVVNGQQIERRSPVLKRAAYGPRSTLFWSLTPGHHRIRAQSLGDLFRAAGTGAAFVSSL
jgi:hypothetical protein